MQILFEASVYDYEEGEHIVIYDIDGKYYLQRNGHCVMTGDFDYIEEVTSDEAIEWALEYAEFEDKDYLNEMSHL